MALTILEDCINCDACRAECPTESVSAGEDIYQIYPETCVECAGHLDEPRHVGRARSIASCRSPRKLKCMARHPLRRW